MKINKLYLKSNRLNILTILILFSAIFTAASAQVLIWTDSMTTFPTNWTTGGSGGTWTKVSTRYNSASYSAKCTPNSNYSNNQNNWMQRTVNLSGYMNGSVVFYIWQNTDTLDYIYFEYLSGGTWISYWARAGNYGGFSQQVMNNLPNTATAIRFRFQSDASVTNEGVYIDDISVFGYRYDVGCTQINVPTGTLDSGVTVTPQAVVKNFGDFISTFNVRMRIGTFYSNAVQVANLIPGGTATVNFATWTALQRGVSTVRCSTEHPNDIYKANDRALGSVEVRVRNVGAASIVAPTGTVDSGQVITPSARIRNYGTTTETFDAYYWLGSSYSSIKSVTLSAGASCTTNFDPWTALPRGSSTTKCSTALSTDMKNNDNRTTGTVTVRVRNVAVTTILAPTGVIDSIASLTSKATLKNYGTDTENLTAIFRISGPSNWSTTANVNTLTSGETRTISFSAWNIGTRGNYTTRCTTNLVGDQISANDYLDSNFVVRVHDAGVVSISSPPASVDSGSTVPVTATVQNYGTESETFSVLARIGSFYTNTRTVTLTAGASQLVAFDNWVVTQSRNTYTIKCTTQLATDSTPGNNFKTSNVTINVHDVGVVTINAPPSQVDTNTTNTVSAQVRNYGTYSETFDVIFQIGSFYTSTRTITLNPNTSNVVTFDDWNVLQPRGSYATKCSTALSSDILPANDYQTGSVAIRVHDVGVASISSPLSADSAATLAVSAQVTNYGTGTETFTVQFRIGSFYSSNVTTTLPPSTTNLVTFDDWTVLQPRGSYATKCSTLLSNDVNRNNDYQNGSVTLRVHDVGTVSISSPPASVDSSSTVPVTATVQNYGTESETFSVLARIGSFYTSTRTVTLAAGASQPVTFDNWVVTQPRNTYTIKCTTQLANDAKPSNNRQTGSVTINVHDVGVATIISPTGQVDSSATTTVSAQIRNYGTYSETFNIVFKIGSFYTSGRSLTLGAGNASVVTFDNWTVTQPRGSYTTKCSTQLASDLNVNNNYQIGSVAVRIHDVGVVSISSPVSADSAATVAVSAQVTNYGTETETFTVQFRIGSFYSSNATTTLLPSATNLVTFDDWTVLQPRGDYATKCSTLLSNDIDHNNDYQNGSVTLKVHDVAVVSVNSPPGAVDSSSTVPVTATIENFGTENETFSIQFRIGTFYTSSKTLLLPSGEFQLVTFDNWLVTQPRNSYAIKCTTQLAADANPGNNLKDAAVKIDVHNVGVVAINSPTGQVDSSATTTVSVQVRNYGTYAETFNVIFEISDFYTNTRSLTLGAGNSSAVTFDDWTVRQPRGNYTAKCSTQLTTDVNPFDDVQTGSATVMVHDVAVSTIYSPPAQVDTNTTQLVSASAVNNGTYSETFDVVFKIGDFYTNVRTLTLNPGGSHFTMFDNWVVCQPRGIYVTQCSTQLSGDANHGNDKMNGTVSINVHDVGVRKMPALSTPVDSGSPVTIRATVANYGAFTESFSVHCLIGSAYNSTRNITALPAGDTTQVTFDLWTPLNRGNNIVRCTTDLANDENPSNNLCTDTFFVVVRDIATQEILAPTISLMQRQWVTPKVRFENLGNQSASFPAWFKITHGLIATYLDYLDTIIISLDPGAILDAEFSRWSTESLTTYRTEARCELPSDMNPANDAKGGSFSISVYTAWFQKTNLLMGSGKKVKAGGALVSLPNGSIYCLKGTNTNEFFRYDIATESWVGVSPIPYSPLKAKNVKAGGALCYGQSASGGYIYALKGNNTTEFWRYSPEVDSWYEKKPVPLGPKGKRIKGGNGLVYVTKGDSNFIYCLKGAKTDEFYAYWIEGDTWLTRKTAPLAPSGKAMAKGSCIAYDGANTIYALKAKVNDFATYDISADSWQIKPIMPFFGSMLKKKKAGDGAAMAGDGNNMVYAFKGGNTNEFWAYSTVEDTWLILDPIPLGLAKKKVKSGASLCYSQSDGMLYGLKGGNTTEFWMYAPLPSAIASKPTNQASGAMSNNSVPNTPLNVLNINPNPFINSATVKYTLAEPDNVTLKLYDVSGQLVKIISRHTNSKSGIAILNSDKLSAGIYILRLETSHRNLTKKVIINR